MAELKPLISAHELKTKFLSQVARSKVDRTLFIDYDHELDVLVVLLVPKGTEYSVYFIDQYIALLYEPDTLEIIGIMVEDFERGFLQKYPAIQDVWNETKQVALELAHVTEDLIGEPGAELVAALA